MNKYEVPQINLVTKVSEMYWIEFSQKLNLFNANKLEELKKELKNHPIRYYEVFFFFSL